MGDGKENPPAFICDAMHGGLARWLRAAGYDALFVYGIDDRDLIAWALETGRVILSSDGPLFERNIIKDGTVQAIYVPQQLSKLEALSFVLAEMKLPIRPGRCMSCGGKLDEIPKHTVIDEAPPLAFKNCDQFWRCSRCNKLLWHGTHWQRIAKRLENVISK